MIQAVKGTKDVYGAEMVTWVKMEEMIRHVCRTFCIDEIRTPMFEYTELFVKSTGETTDVVQKEMYTFLDKGNRSITLKPEVTGAVVRAFIEHSLYANSQLSKFFYLSPCFRYENTQRGRLREFHQFGIEYFGSHSPAVDAEVISVGQAVLHAFGIDNTTLQVNSLGGNQCRAKYNAALKAFLAENLNKLCPTCRERFEKNPLRILDCKDQNCQAVLDKAPTTIEVLDAECRTHFDTVLRLLGDIGIKAVINPKIVRGLDYYTRTVFEFVSNDIGSQSTVCGGGRYDNMMRESGGPDMGCVGFALGLERLMMLIADRGLGLDDDSIVKLFVGAIGEAGFYKAQILAQNLRKKGVNVEADLLEGSVKAQLKHANKIGAEYAVVIGENEMSSGTAKIKNMATGDQTDVALDNLYEYLSKGEQ